MTEQSLPVAQSELESWLREIEQAEPREAFLQDGRLNRVAHTIHAITAVCVASPSPADQPWRQLHVALRLLRNISALGGAAAAGSLVAANVPGALAATATALLQQQQQGQEQEQHADMQLALVITAQALGNLAMSSSEGAAGVWKSLYPTPLQGLLAHDAPKVHDPATMCLYACCRASAEHSQQLCSGPQGRFIWETPLQRAVSDQQASTPGGRPRFQEGSPPAGCSEWLSLLVSCVCLKQGLLWVLLQCLGQQGDTRTPPDQQQLEQTPVWTRYTPVALHILAHEATVCKTQQQELQQEQQQQDQQRKQQQSQQQQEQQQDVSNGEAQVAAEEQLSVLHISGAQINAEQGSQPQLPWAGRGLPPWHRCLLQVLHTCILAARSVHASVESSGSGTGGDGGVEASRHGAAVLEASLEVLRSLGMRDDMGRGLAGGARDPVLLLSTQHGLVHHVLGMLATLQPIQNPRRNVGITAGSTQAGTSDTTCRSTTGGTPLALLPAPPSPPDASSSEAPASSSAPHQQQVQGGEQQPQQQVPVVALPQQYRQGMPVLPPYIGYRGDLLGVLANAMYERPPVAEAVAAVPGAVELLLAQCQLDDSSPLAKEWGLWAIRNLCAGSEAARTQIAALKPVAAVESPELSALGMRMEWDSSTGRMKVVRTEQQR